MRIGIVSRQIAPLVEGSAEAKDVSALAESIISAGHDVEVIIPLPAGMDPGQHSLARRLSTFDIESGGKDYCCVRYDGRTAAGVDVHLIEVEGKPFDAPDSSLSPEQAERFCRAATALLPTLGSTFDWCLSWNAEAALVHACSTGDDQPAAGIRRMMVASSLAGDPEVLSRGVATADRVVILDRNSVSRAIAEEEPLRSKIADGSAVVLDLPVPAQSDTGPAAKASAKAAMQLRAELPVRAEVPLIYFSDADRGPFRAPLRKLLEGDVQVLCPAVSEDLEALSERYRDRLALVSPSEPTDDLLRGADACLVGVNARLVSSALTYGTVPVAGPSAAADLVDLEPSCQSGTGIVIPELTEEAILKGLKRFCSAFASGPAFGAMAARLPGYATTWSDAARHCLTMMGAAPNQ